MFRHNLAYRHENGDMEGFTGFGFTQQMAHADAVQQVRYKVHSIGQIVHPFNVIEKAGVLTLDEFNQVASDWQSGLRYNSDGSPWPGGNKGPGCSGLPS